MGVSFSTAFLAFSNWAGDKKATVEPRLLFVHLDPTSELMPLSVGYPIFLDLAKEDLKNRGKPKYWPASKLRAFGLQTISLPMTKGTARESFIMWPRPKAATPDGAQSRCCIPIEEWLEVAGKALLKGTMTGVTVVAPSTTHWTLLRDRKYMDYQQSVLEALTAKGFPNKGNPAPPPKGKGRKVKPSIPRGGGNPPATNPEGDGVEPSGNPGDGVVAIPFPFPKDPTAEQVEMATSELLSQCHRYHLESLLETGGIRLVDRMLTEALMTEFARLGAILSKDLAASLRAFQTQIRGSGQELHNDLWKALNHLPCEVIRDEPFRVIGDYRESVERDVTTLLATIHLVLHDMEDFLQKCLKDAGAVGETKILFQAMLDHFLTHSEQVKNVVFSPAMDHWAVSTCVSTALSALQPLTAYSFSRILSGSFSIKSPKGAATASGEGEQAVKTEPEGDQGQPKPDLIHPLMRRMISQRRIVQRAASSRQRR